MKGTTNALLRQTAQAVIEAAMTGALGGNPIPIQRAETIAGPRAGAIRLFAGLGTGDLMRVLSRDDAALARQFIAWAFPGDVSVFLDGRAVRIEAPWPHDLALRAIRLQEIGRHPHGGLRWIVGIDEIGRTVIGGLSDAAPHWLVAGTTGSGKTTALLGAALQLARDPAARLVLIDGKGGAGLGRLASVRGVVGPVATDVPQAQAALGWAYEQMKQRYERLSEGERPNEAIVVVFDEFQEMTGDPLVAELLRRLVSSGRAARVHCLLATQHPSMRMFGGRDGGAIKRNLPARLALRVTDAKASEVAVGGPRPRADRLTGAGDAYTVVGQVHRVQVALVDGRDIAAVPHGRPAIERWPAYTAEDVGQEVEKRPRWTYSGRELGVALVAAALGRGRPWLQRVLESRGMGRPGSVRAARLMGLAREQRAEIEALGGQIIVPAELPTS